MGMTIKIDYNSCSDIGTFFKLTNKFCIVPSILPKKTLIKLRNELGENFPIIFSNVLGSACQGRLIACNSKGVLLPFKTCSEEFNNIKEFLPENVVIKYIDENFSSLGNCVVV